LDMATLVRVKEKVLIEVECTDKSQILASITERLHNVVS